MERGCATPFLDTAVEDVDFYVNKYNGQGRILTKSILVDTSVANTFKITAQRGWVNGFKKWFCYQCEVKNKLPTGSTKVTFFNTDDLYIKQVRDCTIHIQPIPGFRNSNEPLDKNQLLTFDATTLSKDITIDKIINIIDDDDCGASACVVYQDASNCVYP